MTSMNSDELIDLHGIADLLGVEKKTPNQWRQRSRKGKLNPPMPEPDFPHLARPLWKTSTIVAWAKTRRKKRALAEPNAETNEVIQNDGIMSGQLMGGNPAIPPVVFSAPDRTFG